MTREEAARLGLVKYETGVPCKHGHTVGRYTVSGICIECSKINNKKNIERFRRVANSAKRGYVVFSAQVHPDDVEALRAYAAALDLERYVPVDIVSPFL